MGGTQRKERIMKSTRTADIQAEAIHQLMRQLNMPYARKDIASLLHTATVQTWSPYDVLNNILTTELKGRKATSLKRRLQQLGIPESKTFDTFDFEKCSIEDPTLRFIQSLEWIRRKENLVVVGPSGTGKTHLLQAVAHKEVLEGGTAHWFTLASLEATVNSYRVDFKVEKKIAQLAKASLIIIDDIGLLPISDQAAEGLYRLVEACYEKTSIALSGNIHPSQFDQIMPPTLATATVDRLMHHAHLHVTTGQSFRMTQALNGQGTQPINNN